MSRDPFDLYDGPEDLRREAVRTGQTLVRDLTQRITNWASYYARRGVPTDLAVPALLRQLAAALGETSPDGRE